MACEPDALLGPGQAVKGHLSSVTPAHIMTTYKLAALYSADDLDALHEEWDVIDTAEGEMAVIRLAHDHSDAVCSMSFDPNRSDLNYGLSFSRHGKSVFPNERRDFVEDIVAIAELTMTAYAAGYSDGFH
jgi:hypothetical protein